MTMTIDKLAAIADKASVDIALRPEQGIHRDPLPPRLWEALRVEMQRRLRRATGEPHAVVTFEFGTEAP